MFPNGCYTYGTIIYTWNCARCGTSHNVERRFRLAEAIWTPALLPDGWQRVNRLVLCPNHTVAVTIDGCVTLLADL